MFEKFDKFERFDGCLKSLTIVRCLLFEKFDVVRQLFEEFEGLVYSCLPASNFQLFLSVFPDVFAREVLKYKN